MTRIGLRQRQLTFSRASRGLTIPAGVVPQLIALGVSAIAYVTGVPAGAPDLWVLAILAVAFAGLRITTMQKELVASTYVLDAVAVAVFIGGTGDGSSPFLALAVAGAWWAGQKAGRGTWYGIAFAAAYLVLVVPPALRHLDPGTVIYQPVFVAVVGLAADRLNVMVTSSRWAFAVLNPETNGERAESVRVGLSRAVRGGLVPIDVLLTAGQLGLTAMQTELIAYLILGLSNQEIAEALSVSEATVRYRLTRLYRVLDVRGRKAAAERARELGLDALVGAARTQDASEPPQSPPQ